MKYIKVILIIFVLILSLNKDKIVLAEVNGFSTKELSEEEKKSISANINVSMSNIKKQAAPIDCFDVNEKGLIAIGSSDSEKKTISIYSTEGTFLYGYKFTSDGSFGLQWENDNIIIYFVRSALAVTVNPAGEVENILEIEDTMENNSYWNYTVFSTKRIVGDYQYVIRKDMGILNFFQFAYSQLVVIDDYGKENIIYDVNFYQGIKSVVIITGVILFISIAVIGISREFIKLKDKG